VLPVTINNLYDTIPSDACDYGHGCPREPVAVVAFFAHDDGEPLDAIAERRPFCGKHLGVYASYLHENSTRCEIHPVSRDDLCGILEVRGSLDCAVPEGEL